MKYLTSPKLYKKNVKVMIKSVIIENKEVKYDDKEFEFCVDNQTQKVFLCYRGNGVGIKNPKENLSCNYMFRSKNVNVEIIKNGVDYSNITSLDLSKCDTSKFFKDSQPSNIPYIISTLFVTKFDKFISCKNLQLSNIQYIFFTFFVLR